MGSKQQHAESRLLRVEDVLWSVRISRVKRLRERRPLASDQALFNHLANISSLATLGKLILGPQKKRLLRRTSVCGRSMMPPSARKCLAHVMLSKCALCFGTSSVIAMLPGYLTEFALSFCFDATVLGALPRHYDLLTSRVSGSAD